MDFTGSNEAKDSFKRKKKRSLNQRVKKKFNKSAPFKKGRRLDDVEHEYFVRVFELMHIFEGTDEERVVFANNALAQTENREVDCSFNQLISRVIENLLPLASNEVLERYFKAFGENLRPVCVHDFASHVLQALMIIATKHSLNEDSASVECKEDHVSQCRAWLLKVCRFLLNNIEEFVWEKYASPALRTAVFCLAGSPHLDSHDRSENAAVPQDLTPPQPFVDLLLEYYERTTNWSSFKDLMDSPLSSRYLQSLLQAIKLVNKKKYKAISKKILTEYFSSESNNSALSSPTALPVLEVMIECSNEKMQKKIYDKVLAPKLTSMAIGRIANITLQKFINKCINKELVAEMVKVLAPEFPSILALHNTGVLLSLCQSCERLSTSQADFFQALTSALQYNDGQDLLHAVLSLTPLPHDPPNLPSHTKHGSQMMQSLLKFHKPIKLVNLLLSLEPKQLADLLSSPYGCHVSNAMCRSEHIGAKSRQRLIHRLMGHYSSLALSKFGSRSFDELWAVADFKAKEQIARDLVDKRAELMNSPFGKFVAMNVRLDDFRSLGVNQWWQKVQRQQSRQKLFAPIVASVQ